MRRFATILLIAGILPIGSAIAQDDALGLYFSDTDFNSGTASTTVAQGFMMTGYIVLTNPTGALVNGYEVGISSSAADFAIPLTNLTFDTNAGSNENQIITFAVPKPALSGGTVLAVIFFTTDSTDVETVSFAASTPSSLPGVLPVVSYGTAGLAACGQPWGTPVVAWLNGQAVPNEPSSLSRVLATYR